MEVIPFGRNNVTNDGQAPLRDSFSLKFKNMSFETISQICGSIWPSFVTLFLPNGISKIIGFGAAVLRPKWRHALERAYVDPLLLKHLSQRIPRQSVQ